MEILKKRILEDGTCYEGGILKVDSFINHQMDPMLMKLIAEEFARRFANDRINKILTIEASGIAPAIMTGYTMQLPVVFAKKKEPKTMRHALSTIVHSFTKDREYPVSISAEYLKPGDRILCIDDFLAYGNAAFGLIDLIRQSGGIYYRKNISTRRRPIERNGYSCRITRSYKKFGELPDNYRITIK